MRTQCLSCILKANTTTGTNFCLGYVTTELTDKSRINKGEEKGDWSAIVMKTSVSNNTEHVPRIKLTNWLFVPLPKQVQELVSENY